MAITFKDYLINEAKYAGFRKPTDTDFEAGKNVRGNMLRRGMTLQMKYRGKPHEAWVEVVGFSDNKQKYGESGVVYTSVKEMLAANNVRSLRELEELDDQNEYGYHHYLILRDLTEDVVTIKDNIFNAYIYKGRWAVGSSADFVSFYEARYVPKRRVTEARYHGHGGLPKVLAFDDYHDIEDEMDNLSHELNLKVQDEELGFIEGMPGHHGYIGLFYEVDRRPSNRQIDSLVKNLLADMHPDPNAVNFADCIASGNSVYYDKGVRTGKRTELYCEEY